MRTGATFFVVILAFLVYQVTTEIIDINFVEYHYHPAHPEERCVATNQCTSRSSQKGYRCCPRIEVMRLPGDGECMQHFCTDTCEQCGRGTLPRRCTSRPPFHTMNIDFTTDRNSHMTFDVNTTVPDLFLIMVCDCYELSHERYPMFYACARLNTSKPVHVMNSIPNRHGYINVTLTMTQRDQDVQEIPQMFVEPSSLQTTTDVQEILKTTTDVKRLSRTREEMLHLKRRQNKESDIHINVIGITVTCIAGGLAVGIPFVTLLIVNKISKVI